MSPARRIQEWLVPVAVERFFSELAVRSLYAGVETLGWLSDVVDGPIHDIDVERDIQYGPDARHHRLDVYRPTVGQPTPVVLYVHGGGFRILSKETHATMAKILARAGYTVCNIDYRLAPEHPYPAAPRDAGTALKWLRANTQRLNVDLDRLVLAGESSGANVVTALAAAMCLEPGEPWAKAVDELDLKPAVVAPTCGFLQVSNPERLAGSFELSAFERDKILEAAHAYLPDAAQSDAPLLADPLLAFERARPAGPLPAFFVAAGTADPLVDDSIRLADALEAHDARCDLHLYEDEVHSFHALYWRQAAKDYWRRFVGFLDEEVGAGAGGGNVS